MENELNTIKAVDIKLNITQEMIDFIKKCKEENKTTASEIAEKINKSSAYISKFEKGDYKTITLDDLYKFVSAAYKCDEQEGVKLTEGFLDNYILNIQDDDKNEIDCGLITYDDVYKKINVPIQLVDKINEIIAENKLSVETIIDKANKNSDLPESVLNDKYPYNIYFYQEDTESSNDNNKGFCCVKMQLDIATISTILSKESDICNYLTIFSFLYTIFRIKEHTEKRSQQIAENIMSKYRFFNLQSQKFYNETKEFEKKSINKMEDFSTEMIFTISKFIDFISYIESKNQEYAISQLIGMNRNLSYDASLFLASLNLPFPTLKKLDYENKQKLFSKIEKYIIDFSKKEPDTDFRIYNSDVKAD